MNITEWTKQLEALRNGRLRLEGPEESGLTRYASTALYELREYVKALEHGYRHLSAEVRRYQNKEKAAEVTGILGLLKHQWSDGAALGYAGMALIQSGMPPHQVVAHLELMEELMEQFDLDYAAEFCQGLKDGGDGGRRIAAPTETGDAWRTLCAATGDGGEIAAAPLGPRNDSAGDCPEWIGASAELKPEVEGC